MKTIYAVAYMTEDEDLAKDLYVETIAAGSREEALGISMLECLGTEIQGRGDKIIMVNVAEHERDDVSATLLVESQVEAYLDEETQKMRKALVDINNLCTQNGGDFADKVFELCKGY